jgi:hypothetical protein
MLSVRLADLKTPVTVLVAVQVMTSPSLSREGVNMHVLMEELAQTPVHV